jgi:hypothetical protein
MLGLRGMGWMGVLCLLWRGRRGMRVWRFRCGKVGVWDGVTDWYGS